MHDGNEALNLFDSVPVGVFNCALRLSSGIHKPKNWETHIAVSNLLRVFAGCGNSGISLKSRFNTLCISKIKHCYVENKNFGWQLCNEPHIWTDSIDVARKYILAGAGDSLQTLVSFHVG